MRGVISFFEAADKSSMRKIALLLTLSSVMTACSPQGNQAIQNIADQTTDSIACKDQKLEEKLWDGLKSYLIEQESIPTADALKEAFHSQVTKLATENPRFTIEEQARLTQNLDQVVDSLLAEAPNGERVETSQELLILLSAIDVGDRTTVFRSYMQDKVRGQLTSLNKTVSALDLDCSNSSAGNDDAGSGDTATGAPAETTPEAVTLDYAYHKQQALKNGEPLSVFGGRWAFATAYQSCQSVQLPSMDDKTPDLQGIKITGTHSDGVGSKRAIASLPLVQSTHPYLKTVSSYGAGCFNVRQSPLIYDYGGKPYGTTSSTSTIDFFKNNGSGMAVLGIDCSGYVYTAMATAGLRLKEGRALKASDSWAWGSTAYVEPTKNGLTCLAKISITPTSAIKAGDIVAVPGHVLLIDKAGADPFGLASVTKEADCSKLTSSSFDFVVAQSSPSKGAVGINYFEARNYLPTSAKMKAGLEKYGYYACLAKFTKKTYTPSLGTLSVVRHKGTSACIAPRVALAKEACISGCTSLER
jgi:cell wall-associated NlpC family hydrolase